MEVCDIICLTILSDNEFNIIDIDVAKQKKIQRSNINNSKNLLFHVQSNC